MNQTTRHEATAQAASSGQGARLVELARRLAFGAALLSISAFITACGGCGNDNNTSEDKCADVQCARGVCSAETGVCVNSDDCQEDANLCLDGYECRGGSCETDYPCNDLDNECDRGVCQVGTCVNNPECVVEADCLPGFVCGDGGACEADPCESGEVTCDRGVCSSDEAACVNKEVCSAASEAEDCLDGFKCYAQECVDEEGFCAALDCQRGVCSFEDGGCIDAEDCGGDDGQCVEGKFCNDANECEENKCDTGMVMCSRGVCDRPSGDCINPDACDASNDCLPDFLCVGNVCTVADEACGAEGCDGNQVCFHEEVTLEASCIENADQGCTNAIDCVDDRVCTQGVCSPPPACEPDAFEPNNDDMSAAAFQQIAPAGFLNANICAMDVDTYTYDTEADIDGVGKLVLQLDYNAEDVGLGVLKAEIVAPNGNVVAMGDAVDGRLDLNTDITIVNKGVYTVRVSPAAAGVTGAGVRYRMSLDVVDTTAITACEMAPVLAVDTPQTSNTVSGDSAALAASCADPNGIVAEDIYAIEIAAPSYVTVTATPSDMTSDVSVSLRADCLRNASEVRGACSEFGGAGVEESIDALLDPGTYYIVVQGPAESTGGSYSLVWTRADVVCTSADNTCANGVAQTCRADGTGFDSENCEQGCNAMLGVCNRPSGDLCDTAPVVDPVSGFTGMIRWGSYRDDYSPGQAGCLAASDNGLVPADGPDVAYSVTLQPNQAAVVDLTSSGNDVSLYVVKDCLDVSGSCELGANAGDADDEFLFYSNVGAAPETVLIVADVAASADGTYTDSAITIDVNDIICQPGTFACGAGDISQQCDATGTGYENDVTCNYGCDTMTGLCLNPPNDTCSGATTITSGVTLMGDIGDFTNTDELASSDCTGFSTPGGDAIFKLAVQQDDIIHVNMTGTFDGALWVGTTCDPVNDTLVGSCIVGADTNFTGGDEDVDLVAPFTGDLFIVVSSFSSSASGNFTVRADVTTPNCTRGQPATCQTANDLEYCDSLGLLQTYTCATTCTNGACDQPTGDICPDPKVLDPTGGSLAGEVIGGTNHIELSSGISGGCYVPAFDETDGRDNIYTIDLAAGDLLTVEVTSSLSTITAYVMEFCGDNNSCLRNFRSEGSGSLDFFSENGGTYFVVVDSSNATATDPYDLSWSVTSGLICEPGASSCQDATTLAKCDAAGAGTAFTTTCSAGCQGGFCLPDVPNADTCAAALAAVDVGQGISAVYNYDNLTDDVQMALPNCVGQITDGPDAFYKVIVQPNEVLNARVIALSEFEDAQVYAFTDCMDPVGTCVAGAPELGGENTSEIFWVNDTGAAATLIVAADNESSFADEVFIFEIEVRAQECTPGARACQTSTGPNDSLQLCNEVGLYEYYTCDGACGTNAPGQCDNPSGEICLDPIPLRDPLNPSDNGEVADAAFLSSDDISLLSGRTGSCHIDEFDESDGPDTFYTISLNAGDVLDVDLVTAETTAYVMIFEGCDASTCVANNVNPGAASVSYYAANAIDVLVVVDATSSTSLDPYTLRWNVTPGLSCVPGGFRCVDNATLGVCSGDGATEAQVICPSGCAGGACTADLVNHDTCAAAAAATPISGGYSTYATYDDLTDDINMPSSNCTGEQTDGPDLFYAVTVQPSEILEATLESYGDEPPLLFIIEDCMSPEATCLAGGQEISSSNTASVLYVNDTGAAKTVIVGADNEFSTADEPFGLSFNTRPPECTPGQRECDLNGSTLKLCNEFGLFDRYNCNGGCGNVTAGQCDMPSGDVCFDALPLTGPTGSVADAAFTGSNSFEISADGAGGCYVDDFDENDGPDTFYSIDLNAGDVLEASITTPHTGAYLFLLEGCSPSSCFDNTWKQPVDTSLYYYAAAATTVYLAVDTDFTSAVTDTYTLDYNVRSGLACVPGETRCIDGATLGVCSNDGTTEATTACAGACRARACEVDVVANDVCATVSGAADVGDGISVFANYDDLTNDIDMPSSNCTGVQTDGPDLFYKVVVNPGEILQAKVESYGDEDPIVFIIEDCATAEATCLAGAQERGTSGVAEVLWANDTGAARTVIVGADNEFSTANEPFGVFIARRAPECVSGQRECGADGSTLKLCNEFGLFDLYGCDGGCGNVTPAKCDNPSGDVCFDALSLTHPSGSIVDADFAGSNNYELPAGKTGGCFIDTFDENDGPDTFYSIDLNAGDVLDITLTTAHTSAYMFLLEGCAGAGQCADNLWQRGSGTLSYYAPQATTLYVAVDSSSTATINDPYTLEWNVRTGLTCAPGEFRCIDNATLGICAPDGTAEASVTCAEGCDGGGCLADALTNDVCAMVSNGADIGAGIAVYTTFDGRANDIDMSSSSCAGVQTDGPDLFYKVIVPQGNVLHAYVESYGDEDPIVYGITDCATAEATCIAGGQELGGDNVAEFYWVNDTGGAATILVGADSELSTADEPFGLFIENLAPQCAAGTTQCTNGQLEICNQFGLYDYYMCDGGTCNNTADGCLNPSGDVCADSITLIDANGVGGPSGSVMGDFTGSNDVILPTGRSAGCFVDTSDESDESDTFYRVELKANESFRAQLVTANNNAHIYITKTCGDVSTCVDNNPNLGAGQVFYYANQDETIYVAVDSSSTSSEDFTLNYEVTPNLLCAPNQFSCKDALNLSKCSADGLSETTTPCNCVDGACVDDVINNDTCALAQMTAPVGDAYALYGTFDDHTDDIDMSTPNCTGEQTDGPDTFVRVELLPNEILHAWVESYGDEAPLVFAFSDCADATGTCVAGGNEDGSTNRAELYHVNDTGANLTLLVAADSTFSTADEPFGLFVEKLQPECTPNTSQCDATNTTLEICNEFGVYEYYQCNGACDPQTGYCANPTGDICLDTIKVNDPVAGTATVPTTFNFTGTLFSSLSNTQTLSNAMNCTSFDSADGPDAIYQVTLKPGQAVDVTQTSLTEDSVLYILTDCGDGGTSCVAGADDTFSGDAETTTYTNNTGMDQIIFIVADSYFSTATDAFDLDITIR